MTDLNEQKKVDEIEEANTDSSSSSSTDASNDFYSDDDEWYDPEKKFRQEPMEDVKKTTQDIEQTYLDAKTELKELEEMVEKFKSLKTKCNKLSDYWYYRGPWSVHMDRMKEAFPEEKYEVHGDDTLFKLSHEFDELNKKLLRETALEMARGLDKE